MEYQVYRKVLQLVAELHVRGFQRLRISPGMAPSGLYWRCIITPVDNISMDNGAMAADWDGLVVSYTSGDETEYFGLGDGRYLTRSQLANRFIERYPSIVEAGRGRDWLYVGWYQDMLSLTYPDLLPIAYADWDWDLPSDGLSTVGGREGVIIPMPPPGEARDRR